MTNSLPWKNSHFHYGKPSISMGHLYHGYVSHNQRVCPKSSNQSFALEEALSRAHAHFSRHRHLQMDHDGSHDLWPQWTQWTPQQNMQQTDDVFGMSINHHQRFFGMFGHDPPQTTAQISAS